MSLRCEDLTMSINPVLNALVLVSMLLTATEVAIAVVVPASLQAQAVPKSDPVVPAPVNTSASGLTTASPPPRVTQTSIAQSSVITAPTTPESLANLDNFDPVAAQVTSVSQLSDVRPTDWAFQALQSLVERYGVIVGYPDRTYRGNRVLTRYEFAAGLNAALNRVEELIAAGSTDLVKKEDLATLQKLQEEFAAELATLRGRVDALEARTTTLEKQQFSTTTKLNGEVIISLASVFGGDRALTSDQWRTINAAATPAARNAARAAAYGAGGASLRDNAIFSDRVRLDLNTSFNGKDRLFTRLEANNTTPFNASVTGTNMTRLVYDTTTNVDNSVQLGKLFYRFPLGQTTITVDAIGGEFFDNFYTLNPVLTGGNLGTISRFGRFSPIYRASNTSSGSNTGAGVSAVVKLSQSLDLSVGYLARRPNDPAASRGLFDGSYGALAQLTFQPTKDFGIGLTYAHSYFSGANNDVTVSGAYGSAFANAPFGAGVGNTAANPRGVATSADQFGLEASYRFSPRFVVSAWGNYTKATARDSVGIVVNRGDEADIFSWAVTLGFPDLGKKGNLGGIVFGQPPKVTRNDYGPPVLGTATARREDSDTSYHLEALYRYQVTNQLSITPGVIVIFNPEHNSNNDTIFAGAIRTTFRF